MEKLQVFIEQIYHTQIIGSIIVVILSFIIYKTITTIIIKSGENRFFKSVLNKKSKTYLRMFKSVIRYVFIILTVLILLQINGINVTSMLAGVGIISVIIGFAVQDALKDIIKGFDIISDSYYNVGDVIKYNGIEGKVLAIGIKTTKIEDVRTFNVISIANRNIEQVEIVSNLINVDIPMPYELDVVKAEKAIQDMLDKVQMLNNIEKCEYRGVQELADSCIKYQIKVYCNPILKVQMNRDVLRCILLGLEENNISVPYNQIDVHQK